MIETADNLCVTARLDISMMTCFVINFLLRKEKLLNYIFIANFTP